MKRIVLIPTVLFALAGMDFVMAQAVSEDKESVEEVVVTGSFQKSLADALAEKRNADQVLDAVAAEDLGKLPDISIAESIARLPGVVANRDRGNATELSIRGLGPNLSNTLLNGREIATGEASRNIRYETYPAELLNGAYVFKSPRASLVEGGLGGTVDLRTIRPLDFGERRVVVNARASYFDLADDISDADSAGYIGSISYVDQFLEDTLGLVLAYTQRKQPIASVRTNIFNSTTRQEFANSNTGEFDAAAIERIPFGYEALVRGGDDERSGVVAALQWSPNDSLELNADFFYSGVDFVEEQRGFRFNFGRGPNVNAGAIEFGNRFGNVSGADGFITGATVSPLFDYGGRIRNVNEEYRLFDDLYTGGLNLAWNNGPLTVTADMGYSRNKREERFVSVETEAHNVSGAPFEVNSGLSGTFRTSPNAPAEFGFNFDLSDPRVNLPSTVRVPSADSIVDEIDNYALNFEYDLGGGLFSALNAGVRCNDREKSLLARSDFRLIDPRSRTAVPAGLLGAALTGAGSVSFPATLTFDRQAVIDRLFGGIAPRQTNSDKIESWVVEERILAAYASADFAGNLGALPFSGNIGVRIVNTETVSSSTFLENSAQTGSADVLKPFSRKNDYTDVLPSLNLSFFPADEHIVRLGLSKAMARAPLDDLNAGVGEYGSGGTPGAFGGNPSLKPFRANQIDLTWEWYFADDAAVTIGGFYKDIDTFIVRETRAEVTLPSGVVGNFTQPVNGEGGNIRGLEFAYTRPLSFLPKPFDGLGIYANYAYTQSDIEVGPAFVEGRFPLPGLAENTFNAQLWYYKNGFEARIGYRYRDAYPAEPGDVPNQILFNDSEGIVDFQASYEFPSGSSLAGLKLLFQANNLSDEPLRKYYSSPSARGRFEEFGVRYWLGFSYRFYE